MDCAMNSTKKHFQLSGNKKNRQFKKKDEVALNEKGDQWYDDIVDFQNRRESIQEFLKDNSRRGSLYYG